MIIQTILNIIGIVFQVVGSLVLAVSSLTQEFYPYIIKLFLWCSKKIGSISGKKLPLSSKDWFFEGLIKEILAYIGSENVQPQGLRFTIGICLILIGFFLQLFSYVFLLPISIIIYLCIAIYLILILINYDLLITAIKKIYSEIKKNSGIYKNNKQKRKIKTFLKTSFLYIFGFVSIFIFFNLDMIFNTLLKFKLWSYPFKIIRWILSIGISKSERERTKEKAFDEFKKKYGNEWEEIAKNIFEQEETQ
jgi:hypothetical protein